MEDLRSAWSRNESNLFELYKKTSFELCIESEFNQETFIAMNKIEYT